jgi:hypothetical protein
MGWIRLTDPEGNPIELSVEQVVLIRTPATGEVDPRAKAVVDLANGHLQAVRESFDAQSHFFRNNMAMEIGGTSW